MTCLAGHIVGSNCAFRGVLTFADGRIAAAREDPDVTPDFGDAWIVPGFVDIHTHGVGPHTYPSEEAVAGGSEWLVRFGVTSFYPTVASIPPEGYEAFLRTVARLAGRTGGARIAGAHLEGPFINPVRKGGMDEHALRPPDADVVDRLIAAAHGEPFIITLSPELPGALPAIRRFSGTGNIVALGHSNASTEILRSAVDAGARIVTHLHNVFLRPGEIEADSVVRDALSFVYGEARLWASVVGDLRHVSADWLRRDYKGLGPERFVLMSDLMPGAGLPEGEHAMPDGRRYVTSGGVGRLADTGVMAGSVVTLNRMVMNLMSAAGIGFPEASHAASRNAAMAVGIGERAGALQPGMPADAAVIDRTGNCLATYVGGRAVHRA